MSITSLVLLLLGGFVVKMFWCKYICPLGAASNIFKFTWLLLAAATISASRFGRTSSVSAQKEGYIR